MKHFTTGLTFLRTRALEHKLIDAAENDDILVQRLAALIKHAPDSALAEIRATYTKAGDVPQEPSSGGDAGQQS